MLYIYNIYSIYDYLLTVIGFWMVLATPNKYNSRKPKEAFNSRTLSKNTDMLFVT